jgi:hypothetical protein
MCEDVRFGIRGEKWCPVEVSRALEKVIITPV